MRIGRKDEDVWIGEDGRIETGCTFGPTTTTYPNNSFLVSVSTLICMARRRNGGMCCLGVEVVFLSFVSRRSWHLAKSCSAVLLCTLQCNISDQLFSCESPQSRCCHPLSCHLWRVQEGLKKEYLGLCLLKVRCMVWVSLSCLWCVYICSHLNLRLVIRDLGCERIVCYA